MGPRVLVALSGGVDSAVAAELLIRADFEVCGVTLKLWSGNPGAEDSAQRAHRVAMHLGIPFTTLDAEHRFRDKVVDYFLSEYAAGRTPNPCVVCNQELKFRLLFELAAASQIPFVATGHYARVRQSHAGYRLIRGLDRKKDQSYFLHRLRKEQLSQILFPVGDYTKQEIRRIAQECNLPAAGQAESQDICFIPAGDYRQFLARFSPELCQPGPIRDSSGNLLGQHQGCAAYTIGQRKGLGISASEPLYVLAIESAANLVIVGSVRELGRSECRVQDMYYISGTAPTQTFSALAQIRYRAEPTRVTVTPSGSKTIHVQFVKDQRDITPGQFLVLYRDQAVIGGGAICAVSEPCYNTFSDTRQSATHGVLDTAMDCPEPF